MIDSYYDKLLTPPINTNNIKTKSHVQEKRKSQSSINNYLSTILLIYVHIVPLLPFNPQLILSVKIIKVKNKIKLLT